MMLPRPRRDGPPRSVADLELPLAIVFALAAGLLLAMWLNGLGGSASDGDVLRRAAADRPQPPGVQAELEAGATQRRIEAARAHARVRRVHAARLQRRR